MRAVRLLTRAPFLRSGFATGTWRVGSRPIRAWLVYHGAFVEDVDRAFADAWSPEGWRDAWIRLARERESAAAAARVAGDAGTARRNRVAAALYAHVAPYFVVHQKADRERLLRWSESLYRGAVSLPGSGVEPVRIPWRGSFEMPGYLHVPEGAVRPPVVVIANALEHYKEAWHALAGRLVARGVAALTFDAPGEGEMWPFTVAPLHYAGVGTAVLDFLATRDDVDGRRAGLLGISVGGTLAALAAAGDARWAACGAVSPAFDATAYVTSLPPFLVETMRQTTGAEDDEALARHVAAYSLADKAHAIVAPLVVVRAGKDVLVPPEDADRLLEAASSTEKRLVDMPDTNHAGVERIHDAMDPVLDFLAQTLRRR